MHIPNSGGGAILFSSHRVKKIAAGIKIQLLIVIHYLEEEREKEMSSAKRNRELSRKLKDSVSLIQEELQLDPNGKFIKISLFRSVSMRTEQVRSTSNNSHPFNTPLYLHQSLIIFTDLNH